MSLITNQSQINSANSFFAPAGTSGGGGSIGANPIVSTITIAGDNTPDNCIFFTSPTATINVPTAGAIVYGRDAGTSNGDMSMTFFQTLPEYPDATTLLSISSPPFGPTGSATYGNLQAVAGCNSCSIKSQTFPSGVVPGIDAPLNIWASQVSISSINNSTINSSSAFISSMNTSTIATTVGSISSMSVSSINGVGVSLFPQSYRLGWVAPGSVTIPTGATGLRVSNNFTFLANHSYFFAGNVNLTGATDGAINLFLSSNGVVASPNLSIIQFYPSNAAGQWYSFSGSWTNGITTTLGMYAATSSATTGTFTPGFPMTLLDLGTSTTV